MNTPLELYSYAGFQAGLSYCAQNWRDMGVWNRWLSMSVLLEKVDDRSTAGEAYLKGYVRGSRQEQ